MKTFITWLEESMSFRDREKFDAWLENLDTEEVIELAEVWGKLMVAESNLNTLKEIKNLQHES